MSSNPYTVEVDGDLIIIQTFRQQSADNVQAVRAQVEALLAQKHAPKDILVRHAGDLKASDDIAMQATMQSLREVPFRRLAVVATLPKRIGLMHSLFQAVGATDRLKVFRDEALAREWLKEARQPLRTKLKKHAPRSRPKKAE